MRFLVLLFKYKIKQGLVIGLFVNLFITTVLHIKMFKHNSIFQVLWTQVNANLMSTVMVSKLYWIGRQNTVHPWYPQNV
jgi:uncharacterized membrane protein